MSRRGPIPGTKMTHRVVDRTTYRIATGKMTPAERAECVAKLTPHQREILTLLRQKIKAGHIDFVQPKHP